MLNKIWDYIKRIKVELVILATLWALLFIFDFADEIKPIGEGLLMYKVLLFSASQVHALAMRKLLFPYIDFKNVSDNQRWMAIALHVSAAYVYAIGG